MIVGVGVMLGLFVGSAVFVIVGVFVCVDVVLGWGAWVRVGIGVCVTVEAGVSLAGCVTVVGVSVEGKALHAIVWSRQVIEMTNR